MPVSHLLLDSLFICAVIFIWMMLLYQFILSIGGYLLFRKQDKTAAFIPEKLLPSVSILIPCRNEQRVIGKLLDKLTSLDYPKGRMEIIVINDNSTDGTGQAALEYASRNGFIRIVDMPFRKSGSGKSAALNFGLSFASHEVIAVYDADNWPDRMSLKLLCTALMANPELAAVTGKFRAYNRKKNLLTRMIDIESIAFQWLIQAGRWKFFKIGFLPGTNFVIRRSVLKKLGGWDELALSEDTELTFRLYEEGYRVMFLPSAVTWEQEPERISSWVRQRTRWARGNFYIIAQHGRRIFTRKRGNSTRLPATVFEMFYLLNMYYFFIFSIIISDTLFVLSLAGVIKIRIIGPFAELWGLALLLFILQLLLSLSFEREDTLKSPFLILLSYLTYTKLWLFVVLKSLWEELILKKEKIWAKTERFDTSVLSEPESNTTHANIRPVKTIHPACSDGKTL